MCTPAATNSSTDDPDHKKKEFPTQIQDKGLSLFLAQRSGKQGHISQSLPGEDVLNLLHEWKP